MTRRLFEISRVGIYADERFLHAVEVRRGLSGAEISRAGSSPLESESPDAFASALKQAFLAAGIASHKVSLALRGSDTFLRYFEMPILPRREWAKGVRFESQKYSPFPVAETVSGFQISAESGLKKLKVAFAGAKKSTVAAAVASVKRAGLNPVAVEPLVFSILRAYASRGRAPEGTCEMLVHAAPGGSMSLIIVKDGLPFYAHHGASSPVSSGYEGVLAEVRLTIGYFSKYFRSEEIGRLVLCGSEDATWAGRLAQEFGIPADIAAGIPNAAGEAGRRAGAACAAGAALGGMAWFRHGVNLVSAEPEPEVRVAKLSPAERRQAFVRAIGAGAGAVATVVMFVYIALAASHNAMRVESSHLEADAKRLEPADVGSEIAGQPELRVAELQQKSAFVRALTDDRVFWTDKMSEIARLLPQGVRLSITEYTDDDKAGTRELKLEGTIEPAAAPDAVDIVNRFVADLGANPVFMKGFDEAKVGFIRADDTVPVSGSAPARFLIICRSERKNTGEAAS